MSEYVPWIILSVVNIPVFVLYGKLLFGGCQEFLEAIVFWIRPDLWSAVSGELFEDWWAEFKLGLFVVSCVGTVAAEYHFIVGPYFCQ